MPQHEILEIRFSVTFGAIANNSSQDHIKTDFVFWLGSSEFKILRDLESESIVLKNDGFKCAIRALLFEFAQYIEAAQQL